MKELLLKCTCWLSSPTFSLNNNPTSQKVLSTTNSLEASVPRATVVTTALKLVLEELFVYKQFSFISDTHPK